ncbi:hypothetical protein CNMCM5623_001927 [Aspergillus felis]|uniref:Xylanolytic transcriptional activator regulatory domain-containing protein n=1 Tax=Aspergillus felis TaxID=1287682 RepID=A0A8H6Q8I3_9EURO|nr:hypothetical protein CNMCM5623_001927 [Aspergillus felis]
MLAETLQRIDYKAREHKMVFRKQRPTSNASPRTQENQTATQSLRLHNRVISKRHPANGKKVPSAKRTMTLASDNGGSQLSEEDLFQLLINRMRVREENEIAASDLQERMEADMSELAEENKTLKHQLETIDNQLQRSKCQTKTYRAQIENWKAKLVKFKGMLNELGAEYRNLRNENLRLKESKATLENERIEIESSIEDARRQISQAVALVGEERNQLVESEKKIEAMTLALKNAEEKTVFVQTQLMEERRRSSILESYIHNNSRVQTKQLAVIRTEQQEMLSKLNSAFDILGQSVNSSQAATQTTLELTLEKSFSLVRELSEQLSRDRVDIQQCNDIVHKIFSSVNTFDSKLNEGLERTFALNENVAHNLREQLKLFENNNGCHMALLKQLGLNKEQYNAVRERLEALEPSMHKINSSLTTLNEKEIDLAQHITQLQKSISEGQNPALATDVCGLSMENAALKDQIEQLSIKMSSAEENAKAKELETEEAKRALLEATAKMQEEMKRAQDFEAEAVSLRQTTISIETKIREELNRASVISRDQTKARFEQQIHKLLREKVEAEKDMVTIRESLAEAQASMVINVESYEGRFTNGLQAEREHAAKKQRDELEAMVLQREQHIHELEDFRTQEAARMSEQETELELLRKSEAAALAQQKTISQQLDEVQGRIVELNDRLSSKDLEFENLQKKLDTCQSGLLEKEEELTQGKKELCAAESAKSNLETGKGKAKSEIHALLKRLQDSERWMKNIKEAITRPDDPSIGGPLPGTWDKLKDYLSSTDNDNPCSDSQRTTVPAAPNVSNATGCVQTTEVIYRTQSFQGGGLSSPVQINARTGNIDAVGHCERPGSSTEIVPFSSIRQQLSPASGSSLSPEPSDLAEMLDLTPKNKSSQGDTVVETPKEKNEKGNAATSHKADSLDLGMIGGQSRSSQHQPLKLNSLATETADGHTNATEEQEKQRTVTFETENKATRIEKRKFSATVENPPEESASENRLVERPERTTKRTYSRFQRSPKSKRSPKFSNQSNASPASELSNRGTHAENQYTSNDKRARVSVAPSNPGTRGQAQGTANYLERRTTPARSSSPSALAPEGDTNTPRSTALRTTPTQGFLLKDGTSTRYVNELFFSRVLEKENELQSAINTPTSTNSSEWGSLTAGFDGLISNPQLSVDIHPLYPSRRQATQLWQSYLNNVDVLLKVLHVPTTQPVIYAAINNTKNISLDQSALLFSIYYAAVTSLRAADILLMFGEDRQSVLKRFQRGLEVSLHMAKFLDSPTIISLQAMSIYLLCYRHHNGGRSGWILNGIVLRMAQCIGLHRDGEQFHLPPFECEIRRRLWYQILNYDARVSEDHALSTNGFGGFSDTKMPLNVDDRDIYPTMEVAPVLEPRWREMTLFLVAAEMNQALQKVYQLSVAVLNGNDKMASLEQLLRTITTRIKDCYLQHCDSNIPIQKAAVLLGQVQIGKLNLFVNQQYLRGLSAEESAARATEQTLLLACDTIDIGNELKTDELLSKFHWLFSAFTQYHLLTYTLWHLCVQPGVRCVDRAWQVVDRSFELVENPSWPSPGPKWNVLRNLRDKALDIRRSFSSSHFTSNQDSSKNPVIPRTTGQLVDDSRREVVPSSIMGLEDMDWNLDSICFPDWDPSSLWLAGP